MPVNLWFPRSFAVFGIEVPTYQLCLYLGFAIFYAIFVLESARSGISRRHALVAGLVIIIAGIDFAWIASLLIGGTRGQSLYVAAFGAVLCGAVYARWCGISLYRIGDAAAPAAALAFAVMKLGCLIGGCCYGRPAEGSFFAVYDMTAEHPPRVLVDHPQWAGLPLAPVQLWVVALCIAAFIASYIVFPWSRRVEGRRLGVVLGIYALGRLIVDFMGGANAPFRIDPLVPMQLFGILMTGVSLFLIFRKR